MPSRELRQRRKEKGLCTVCGKRPLVTIGYCQECRISENNYKKQRREYRKINEICLGCPEPIANHSIKYRDLYFVPVYTLILFLPYPFLRKKSLKI